ncbi:MAG: sulfite exporter TauE/SafE family protein [Actinomycetota bacterium]|nr:sulfite exporter TauE/SafE family protein [Actinomycetota bacterium]
MDVVLILLGLLMGGALGALGGGGSILAVPMLVYIAGESVKVGTAASLVAVGSAALAGAIGHYFGGRVRVSRGLVFGIIGSGGSVVGSLLNKHLNQYLLLVLFSALMFFVAWRMVKAPSPRVAQATTGELEEEQADIDSSNTKPSFSTQNIAKLILAASGVGFLTGFFGVGGGFVVVPALVLFLGFKMEEAIGTSLLVISVNSAVALLSRLGSSHLHWGVILFFSAGAFVGSLAGSRMMSRLQGKALKKAFVVLLIVLALYMAGNSIYHLVH